MDKLMSLEQLILTRPPPALTSTRLSTVVTALMLVVRDEAAQAAHRGISSGLYSIDERLVQQVFEGLRATERIRLVRTSAFGALSPVRYRRLYSSLWKTQRKMSGRKATGWRYNLASSLRGFLGTHPQEGFHYAETISSLMSDRVEEISLAGLSMAGYLGKAMTPEIVEILIEHLETQSLKTMNSLNALAELYKRWATTPPRIRQILSSPEVKAKVLRYLTGQDDDVRLCSSYCANAMRRALSPTAGRRVRARGRGRPLPQ